VVTEGWRKVHYLLEFNSLFRFSRALFGNISNVKHRQKCLENTNTVLNMGLLEVSIHPNNRYYSPQPPKRNSSLDHLNLNQTKDHKRTIVYTHRLKSLFFNYQDHNASTLAKGRRLTNRRRDPRVSSNATPRSLWDQLYPNPQFIPRRSDLSLSTTPLST
jgi:hypothetical protein